MARHNAFTPERTEHIIKALRAGNYLETAASMAGIHRATVYRWLNEGRDAEFKLDAGERLSKDEEAKMAFYLEVDQARAEARAAALRVITNAATTGQWQAAAWFLERTAPQEYGRFQRTEISGPNEGPLEVQVSAQDLESLVQRILGDESD